MNDPHVVSLKYTFNTPKTVAFENPPPLPIETSIFNLLLEDNILTVTLKSHFSTIEEARIPVDNYLKGWELDLALQYGRREFRFNYETANVIDRNPTPNGSAILVQVQDSIQAMISGVAAINVPLMEYPRPSDSFQYSNHVEVLWNRYERYIEQKELQTSAAYFCLTYLESLAGDRKKAGKQFRIHEKVLSKLGELTVKGDENTARKVQKGTTFEPLTIKEQEWIDATVKAIIRRVAEVGANPSIHLLTMNDLPPLS